MQHPVIIKKTDAASNFCAKFYQQGIEINIHNYPGIKVFIV